MMMFFGSAQFFFVTNDYNNKGILQIVHNISNQFPSALRYIRILRFKTVSVH